MSMLDQKVLLEESFDVKPQETSTEGKRMYLEGAFLQAETKNRNGRWYKREQIEEACHHVNNQASKGRYILGELDHPADQLEVSLENVSHKLIEMNMHGNDAIGKAELLDTPKGLIAQEILKSGVNLGVSSRGSGKLNESTGEVETYNFETVDIVSKPSADAYPRSIYEALQMNSRGDEIHKLAEAVRHDDDAQKYFQKEIRKFIESL